MSDSRLLLTAPKSYPSEHPTPKTISVAGKQSLCQKCFDKHAMWEYGKLSLCDTCQRQALSWFKKQKPINEDFWPICPECGAGLMCYSRLKVLYCPEHGRIS